jgi:hypothetical protein
MFDSMFLICILIASQSWIYFPLTLQAPSAPVQSTPSAVQFDAFGTSAPVPQQSSHFDAFGSGMPTPAAPANQSFDDFGDFKAAPVAVMAPPPMAQQNVRFDAFGTQPVNPMNQMNNAFGQMNVGGGFATNNTAAGNGMMQQPIGGMTSAPAAADDDFGDFEGAAPKKTIATPSR